VALLAFELVLLAAEMSKKGGGPHELLE